MNFNQLRLNTQLAVFLALVVAFVFTFLPGCKKENTPVAIGSILGAWSVVMTLDSTADTTARFDYSVYPNHTPGFETHETWVIVAGTAQDTLTTSRGWSMLGTLYLNGCEFIDTLTIQSSPFVEKVNIKINCNATTTGIQGTETLYFYTFDRQGQPVTLGREYWHFTSE